MSLTAKEEKSSPVQTVASDIDVAESQDYRAPWHSRFARWGVEVRGVAPVPFEERTDRRFINVFFVWFTMSTNLLPCVPRPYAYASLV